MSSQASNEFNTRHNDRVGKIRQGYQLLHWADPDFNYWAVSDVSANDLQTFKQQFAAQTPHH
jgi:anti-sigma factor RsiW